VADEDGDREDEDDGAREEGELDGPRGCVRLAGPRAEPDVALRTREEERGRKQAAASARG
jgi:hypothetical protein